MIPRKLGVSAEETSLRRTDPQNGEAPPFAHCSDFVIIALSDGRLDSVIQGLLSTSAACSPSVCSVCGQRHQSDATMPRFCSPSLPRCALGMETPRRNRRRPRGDVF
eukprot:scaffold42022_cov168-Amphora_coffeaeformis.AAC.2